jgi:hypothetical protein
MKRIISTLALASLVIATGSAGCHDQDRTRWQVEFRSVDKPMIVRLRGSLELGSDVIGSDRFFVDSGNFVLGDGSFHAPPPPLVPDSCVHPTGKAYVIHIQDSVSITFALETPDTNLYIAAAHCGLFADGVVRSDTVVGTWLQAVNRAQGPFVMWRDH